MPRFLVTTAVALAVLAIALPAAAQQVKVAVIDVQRVVSDSDPGKAALQKLQQLQNDRVEQGKRLQQELDALRDQLNKQRLTLAPEKLEDLQKQIEDKRILLQRFQDDAARELEEARRKALDQLEQKIMPVINEVGTERGLTLIFNKFQSGLVYADETVDITDEVIRRFNTTQ